ncbi:hypothetical protein [Flavobacterium sp. B17]|uniref:hypothetical protein n=1 Tax=Flavobacterium sp. B17 TaxID=95618 RepID=UPI000349B738|nr:hypothetical protein [Flavobacterium sp. B17]
MVSSNDLIINKLTTFVEKTYFLEIFDDEELVFEDGYPMFMFFDMDSWKIGVQNMKKILSLPFLPVFISSVYSRDIVNQIMGPGFSCFGFLNKKSNYDDFIKEISEIIDERYK